MSFTHPHVTPNLHDMYKNHGVQNNTRLHILKKYLHSCSTDLYKFGTT